MLTERQHQNFWTKVRVNAETGCHEWSAAVDAYGYGAVSIANRVLKTHRVAYALFHGSVPDGAHILHTCDNPRCVRREHLFAGSHQDNMRDKTAKGRHPRGANHGHTKFSTETIRRVFELTALGWKQRWIARELGMCFQHVSAILARKTRRET